MAVKGLKVNSLNMSDDVPGMVLLNTTSFSAVSSQSINNVFSSTYDRYKIMYNVTLAANDDISVRLRVAGTDSTTSSYGAQLIKGSSTSISGSQTALTFWDLNGILNLGNILVEIDLVNPGTAVQTYGFGRYTGKLLASTTQMVETLSGITHTAATAYDGFTLYTASTMTGSVSVYGYVK